LEKLKRLEIENAEQNISLDSNARWMLTLSQRITGTEKEKLEAKVEILP
jgi:hypothetical protein